MSAGTKGKLYKYFKCSYPSYKICSVPPYICSTLLVSRVCFSVSRFLFLFLFFFLFGSLRCAIFFLPKFLFFHVLTDNHMYFCENVFLCLVFYWNDNLMLFFCTLCITKDNQTHLQILCFQKQDTNASFLARVQ